MRKNYLDNIRILCIYILVPFHVSIAFNSWGEANYVFFFPNQIVSSIKMLVSTWFMPILFLIAGISARYSLEKRGTLKFAVERVKKIFLPLVTGILTICPYMAYVADKFHNGYEGSFFEHYKVFFSKVTDFTGYDGFFTPGHLWFLLYLLVASLASLLVIMFQKKFFPNFSLAKINMPVIILLFIPAVLFHFILDFGGKSMGQEFILFLFGYYILYEDSVMEKIKKSKFWLFAVGLLFTIINIVLFIWIKDSNRTLNFLASKLSMWFMMFAILGIFAEYFNQTNTVTKYLSANSFLFYEFHFVWLLAFQPVLADYTKEFVLSSILTIVFTYIATFVSVEVIKRIPVIRFLFGVK